MPHGDQIFECNRKANVMGRVIFVTGTDTDVGKTSVCAWLMAHTDFTYWKPIQTGAKSDSDTNTVLRLSCCQHDRVRLPTYSFLEPLSPHEASVIDGKEVVLGDISPPIPSDLLVEGAGGIFVPLNEKDMMLDLIQKIASHVILVARGTLGTINHTLLTLHALKDVKLPIGVVISGSYRDQNIESIERYSYSHVLDVLPYFEKLTPDKLREKSPSSKLHRFLYYDGSPS